MPSWSTSAEKTVTSRTAVACGRISMSRDCYDAVKAGAMKKGDVLGVARVAGIMGAKRTSDLIPLCHILNLTKCGIEFIFHDDLCEIEGRCTVKCDGKTGVEMEALTAVQVGLLTVYDMLKAVDRGMVMTEICLLVKRWRQVRPLAAVLTGGGNNVLLRNGSSTRALQHCRVKATQAPCRWLHRPLRRANERRASYKFLDVGGDGMRRDAKNAADFRERKCPWPAA